MDERVRAVYRMQNYIRNNLNEEITLSALSTAAKYSPWHSHRLFLCYTGYTPSDYIRKLRLSTSALILRDKQKRITEVALDAGFNTPESYTRAFYREFGLNPKEYALSPTMIPLFIPYDVECEIKEKKNMKEISKIFMTIIEKPKRKVIIKRGIKATNYFSYYEEVECNLWGKLVSIKSISPEPISMWLPKKLIKPGTSEYVQGVEVEADYQGVLPNGFDIIELPSSKYLMMHGEPFNDEDYCEAIEIIWEAKKNYDPKILGYSWDNENPRIQLEPRGERGYIELFPIK